MNIIPCTDDCIYQLDGCCRMEKAGSPGVFDSSARCIHYVPRHPKPSDGSHEK